MSRWTGRVVALALGTPGPADLTFSEISTDTRTLAPGALYVALTGARFDGHRFLGAARTAGAAAAVVRRGTEPVAGLPYFEVEDPLVALGDLANRRRQQVRGPVVAITGTNGKTTTKEMIAALLRTRWQVHATRENRNNLVGVPSTILEAGPRVDALVLEAGANERGELGRLRRIMAPTIAVVTNVTAAHLDGFTDVEGVMGEKLSLLHGLPVAVVGTEPRRLANRARSEAGSVITAGGESDADVTPDRWSVDVDGRAIVVFQGRTIRVPLLGRHHVHNAMIALAVAEQLGVDLSVAPAAFAGVRIPPGRCELSDHGSLRILNDTYNANPASLQMCLAVGQDVRQERPLAVVVGTMLELGRQAPRIHREMAAAILRIQPDVIGAVGDFVAAFRELGLEPGDRLVVADGPEALGKALRPRMTGHELVILKASRGVHLERAIPFITPENEVPCSTTS